MTGVICPSYRAGFASPQRNRGRLKYPELWRSCVGAWAPCLGPTGGTLFDQSVFKNHGTLNETNMNTAWANYDGIVSNGYAVNKYCLLPNTPSLNLLDAYTISQWVYPGGFSNYRNTIYKNGIGGSSGQYGIIVFSDAHWEAECKLGGSPSGVSGGTLTALKWYHLAVTFHAATSTLRTYLNGRPVNTATNASSDSAGTAATIGADATNSRWWSGNIGDTMLFNRALPERSIELLSRRQGIAYETVRTRKYKAAAAGGGFKAAWAAGRQNRIIGGGLR